METFPIKINKINLCNQAKNISVVLTISQLNFDANRSKGSWVMIGQTEQRVLLKFMDSEYLVFTAYHRMRWIRNIWTLYSIDEKFF